MSICPVCRHTTTTPLHIEVEERTILVCSPMCGAIIQALTIANTRKVTA